MVVMRVAIQGDIGSFHHLAANQFFGDDIDLIGCETFEEVFAALASGTADRAVAAISNSWYGVLPEVSELQAQYNFKVIGELDLPIHQALITLSGVSLHGIKIILSHPVALEQCSKYFDEHLPHAERREYHDTAAAVEFIKQQGDASVAAIAGTWAAEIYDLPALAENIENDPNNSTKFVMLSRLD